MTPAPDEKVHLGLPMSAIKVGMRLRSTLGFPDKRFEKTVTEITSKGFKYSLDADVPNCPLVGQTTLKDGGEVYGQDGWSFCEEVPDEKVPMMTPLTEEDETRARIESAYLCSIEFDALNRDALCSHLRSVATFLEKAGSTISALRTEAATAKAEANLMQRKFEEQCILVNNYEGEGGTVSKLHARATAAESRERGLREELESEVVQPMYTSTAEGIELKGSAYCSRCKVESYDIPLPHAPTCILSSAASEGPG